jgi:hypothetical protein
MRRRYNCNQRRRPVRLSLVGILAGVSLLVGMSVPVEGQAALSITDAPVGIALPWSFDGGTEVFLDVQVSHSGDAADYFLTVSPGNSGSFEPRRMDNGRGGGPFRAELPYLVLTPAGSVAKDLTVALNADNVISGSFGADVDTRTASHRFDAALTGDTFQLEDNFSDSVEVSLYQGVYTQPNSAVLRDQRTVNVSSTIPQVYEIRLVSPGAGADTYNGGFDLFLGDITNGATGEVDLLYRTNMRYRLEASSQNGGDLVSDGGDRIGYTITVAGSTYRLNSTRRLIQSNDATGREFVRESMLVTVAAGDVTGKPPGYYTDIVTFDIIAR